MHRLRRHKSTAMKQPKECSSWMHTQRSALRNELCSGSSNDCGRGSSRANCDRIRNMHRSNSLPVIVTSLHPRRHSMSLTEVMRHPSGFPIPG
ncbi:hypothetical protein CY34DRAFT_561973 [Suillus luteus UH-Slu-Lm8-n1]|uniref:Uncharacterized protein n=1 Tax=Suillus luteus UH-Slu-Lm8-n1 TaxID=930992 RepID=A0A0D0AUY6_9AGAM|nr:hypothetical protein CY34DRAFT_561973 [Suillus luteus UH-Slu-Lm8-n1]